MPRTRRGQRVAVSKDRSQAKPSTPGFQGFEQGRRRNCANWQENHFELDISRDG